MATDSIGSDQFSILAANLYGRDRWVARYGEPVPLSEQPKNWMHSSNLLCWQGIMEIGLCAGVRGNREDIMMGISLDTIKEYQPVIIEICPAACHRLGGEAWCTDSRRTWVTNGIPNGSGRSTIPFECIKSARMRSDSNPFYTWHKPSSQPQPLLAPTRLSRAS